MRKTKIDPEMIRGFVDAGLSDPEIAKKMGWTVGTLRVICSLQKISLRRSFRVRGRRLTATIAVPRETFEKMRKYAALMGATAAELAANLLKVIARDNLYKAVLDEDVARPPATTRPDHDVAADTVHRSK